MDNKNKLAITIIVLCVLSLGVGIKSTLQKNIELSRKDGAQAVKNVFNSRNRIALIKLDGVIDSSQKASFFSPDTSAQGVIDALEEIKKDNSVKGVILKINSPGGTVGMSQNVYDEIIAVRAVKPVVVAMDDIAASGGYYISSAADRIIAQRGTLTGSIGVIFSSMDIHELLANKLLITPNVIKSGKYKDIGSGLKAMNDDDRALLKNIIDDSYQQFLSDITKGRVNRHDKYSAAKRELSVETLKTLADGRVFTGQQAYKYGFVDGLGDINVAQQVVTAMAKERFKLSDKELPLVPYKKCGSLADFFSVTSESLFNKKTGASVLDEYIPVSVKMGRQPLYLWE